MPFTAILTFLSSTPVTHTAVLGTIFALHGLGAFYAVAEAARRLAVMAWNIYHRRKRVRTQIRALHARSVAHAVGLSRMRSPPAFMSRVLPLLRDMHDVMESTSDGNLSAWWKVLAGIVDESALLARCESSFDVAVIHIEYLKYDIHLSVMCSPRPLLTAHDMQSQPP